MKYPTLLLSMLVLFVGIRGYLHTDQYGFALMCVVFVFNSVGWYRQTIRTEDYRQLLRPDIRDAQNVQPKDQTRNN